MKIFLELYVLRRLEDLGNFVYKKVCVVMRGIFERFWWGVRRKLEFLSGCDWNIGRNMDRKSYCVEGLNKNEKGGIGS